MLYIYTYIYICTHKLTHRKFTSNKTSQEDTGSGQIIVQSMSHSPKEGSLAREIPGEEKIQVVEQSHRIPRTGILAYVHHKFQPCKIIKGYMYVQLSSVVYFDPTNEPSAESLDIQTAPEVRFLFGPQKDTKKKHPKKTQFRYSPGCLGRLQFLLPMCRLAKPKPRTALSPRRRVPTKPNWPSYFWLRPLEMGELGLPGWGSYPGFR